MLLPELRAEVARYAQKMHASQLVRATQGNLSARDTESGLICITPSAVDYELLTAEDITVVNADGQIVEGKWRPSSETPLHTLILRRRLDINCVMHTHSFYASAFGVVYQPIPVVLAESAACLGAEVPIAPYQKSGTIEFAELVYDVLGKGQAVIWGNHGAMVVGDTLARTYSLTHALEDSARIYAIAKQIGNPVFLPAKEVEQIHAMWLETYNKKSAQ
jgi:ribulose-5-phosphate 4-epimerase/fuculose-1-phosphate aldolase